MAGDTELGVGGGPGSRQMGLCQQNPRLSTPTFVFLFSCWSTLPVRDRGQGHSGVTSRASQFQSEAVLL